MSPLKVNLDSAWMSLFSMNLRRESPPGKITNRVFTLLPAGGAVELRRHSQVLQVRQAGKGIVVDDGERVGVQQSAGRGQQRSAKVT